MAQPPVAGRIPFTHSIHGDDRVDDYQWLRDKDNPETIAYLEAENAYTKAVMGPLETAQQTLYAEMRARIKEADLEVPAKRDDYWYYSRTETAKQYRVYCRKHVSLEAAEEVLLDLNAIAEDDGHEYLQLGVYRLSPDHRFLAYALDTDGSERFKLAIKDLNSAVILETIENVYYGLEWAADNTHLFYTRMNTAMRPYQVWRHALGESADAVVYEEPDETFFLGIGKTRSGAWLTLTSEAKLTSEVRVLPAAAPLDPPAIFKPRLRGVEYSLEHLPGEGFLIVTNQDDAENFKVMLAPEDNSAEQNAALEDWREWLPHSHHRLISFVMPFQNAVAVWGREHGFAQLWVMQQGKLHAVPMPEAVCSLYPGANYEFQTDLLRFQYTSLAQPRQVFDLNLLTLERDLLKQDEVLNGYDPTQYITERLEAISQDGVSVPISLVYRQGALEAGPAPLYLYGYGSYGISLDPWFSVSRVSLLDRGVVFAIAHVRGGQELGRHWYDDGKLLNKRNSFLDFIACAEHLIDQGYTVQDQLAISGGSAGGLLVGATMNLRPELFQVVVASVPFVDVITTMLDSSLPLTTSEYDEWGNPENPAFYEYIKAYSPYDNLLARAYPNVFVTAGLNDPRVGYHEPAKWVAKLRALKTDTNTVLLHTNMGAGHGGASGRFDHLKEIAMEYAFVLEKLAVMISADAPVQQS